MHSAMFSISNRTITSFPARTDSRGDTYVLETEVTGGLAQCPDSCRGSILYRHEGKNVLFDDGHEHECTAILANSTLCLYRYRRAAGPHWDDIQSLSSAIDSARRYVRQPVENPAASNRKGSGTRPSPVFSEMEALGAEPRERTPSSSNCNCPRLRMVIRIRAVRAPRDDCVNASIQASRI